MIEISKELLSEVYSFEVKDFIPLGTDDVTYEVRFNGLKNGTNYNIINIYELAHKCKEWILKQGYRIIIDCSKDIELGIQILKNGRDIYSNENKSEQQAIFKACEWILKEINK